MNRRMLNSIKNYIKDNWVQHNKDFKKFRMKNLRMRIKRRKLLQYWIYKIKI